MSRLEVLAAPGLVLVQDDGRPGHAHLGVAHAGWLDAPSARLGNRLVGNPPGAASLEVALGGLRVRLRGPGRWVAVTGAPGPVRVDERPRGHGEPVWLPAGGELEVGAASAGARRVLSVAGGLDVPLVLGSRSTDTLAWVGPPRVEPGHELPLGSSYGAPAAVDVPVPHEGGRAGVLRVWPGPRLDRLADDAWRTLCGSRWTVDPASNRVGLRLAGARLRHGTRGELPSEGLVTGAVQVPPSGRPVVFLADHPTTGGYPVAAVVHPDDLAGCAQLLPGDVVRFEAAR